MLTVFQYDGVENGDHTPYLIDLVNQGSVIIPDFDIQVPEQFIHPEEPWHLYVPGSQESITSLFGETLKIWNQLTVLLTSGVLLMHVQTVLL